MLHKPKTDKYNIFTIRTSSDSHLHWKNHSHQNSLSFRIYSDFEADNEIDNSNKSNRATNIHKQNPVLNCYHIDSELDDNLQSSYYKSPLGDDNVKWFVNEFIKF